MLRRTASSPLSDGPLVVTTSHKARSAAIERAETFALQWGYEYRSRRDQPFEDMIGPNDAALVFTNSEVRLASHAGSLTSHLGTAFIRLKSFSRSEGDPLIRAGELQLGDRVIDTTFGLGRDAIVAACAVGHTGAVTAVESSAGLFHLGHFGLTEGALSTNQVALIAGSTPAPTEIVNADARQWLAAAPANSADVVLIDPMFDAPKTSDAGFALLRSVADAAPLDQQWVEEARRVARRFVVVKVGPSAPWFGDVGLEPVHSHSNANWWRTSGQP